MPAFIGRQSAQCAVSAGLAIAASMVGQMEKQGKFLIDNDPYEYQDREETTWEDWDFLISD